MAVSDSISDTLTTPDATNDDVGAPQVAFWLQALGWLVGGMIVLVPSLLPVLATAGWQPFGPLLGIVFVVLSLFGELPPWIAWMQRLGHWLFPGIAVGMVVLLVPLLIPAANHETSAVAFSPAVWAAYLSIVLVGLSFEASSFPDRLYHFCQSLTISPASLVPIYLVIAGLLGNVFDGVSIIAISVIIFLSLLPQIWAIRASFAMLFGGLISNLITVAAEPTNIKFQDTLHVMLDRVTPSFWATNWPISVLGIGVPAIGLAMWMRSEHVTWRQREVVAEQAKPSRKRKRVKQSKPHRDWNSLLSLMAILLLGAGIIFHSITQAGSPSAQATAAWPLWLVLLPAGAMAVLHLCSIKQLPTRVVEGAEKQTGWQFGMSYMRRESPVWVKLMIIFSLIWYMSTALTTPQNVLGLFFTLALPIRFGLMVILSLLSSVTDNVALAAMQGALIVRHPLAVWQIRLLVILLTWAGGFTYFGCLQSLAMNSRLKLSLGKWMQHSLVWAALSIAGGLAGLLIIRLLYPTAVGLP